MSDARWMAAAIALGERGRGRTAPNPNVGCVIVRDRQLVGSGWTQPGGRPHAEAVALDRSRRSRARRDRSMSRSNPAPMPANAAPPAPIC